MKLHLQALNFEILTPAWITGASPEKAEIRVPSIRGQLRFWLRMLFPDRHLDEEIFGRADQRGAGASLVSLRLRNPAGTARAQNLASYTGRQGDDALKDPESYFLWPLRTQTRGVMHPIAADRLATFDIELAWLPPAAGQRAKLDPPLQDAVKAFSLLGSFGTRSTRGYGSVWLASANFSESASFARELAFLPASISVRLLPGGARNGRAALAEAAKWFRALRIGSSDFNQQPSRWGKHDHDTAPHPASQSVLHRPSLGLPLAQNYRKSGIKHQTKYWWRDPETGRESWNDRYPSPVRIKVVRIAGMYRVVLVLFRDQFLPAGTRLRVQERSQPRGEARLSRELLDEIATHGEALH
jgi:CRISPR/Cas system CMR-associated protein Cmr1 (group 7 of RAMP superfamily)